jgi:hypothetical protein
VKAFRLAFAIALAAQPLRGLAAQDVAARLRGRVPGEVAGAVQSIAEAAAARGLPVEPLIQKAMEGGAKGVPADRVIAAVRGLVARLDSARVALRDAGVQAPSPQALESGADALNAGVDSRQVSDLVRVGATRYDPAVTLRVAATLTALGVPPKQGVRLLEKMIQAGRPSNDLLDLPGEVQVGMAHGATAAQAAEEAGGAERSEGQHGQHGQQGPQGEQGQQNQPPSPQANPHRP